MVKLKHIKPSVEYEAALKEYILEHQKYNSHMNGSSHLEKYYDDIKAYLTYLKAQEEIIPSDNLFPSEEYMLIREDDNRLIGMINIRTHLTPSLKECGGHIGYGVRPTERQKGYNKINLYLALKRCQELGIEECLLDCTDDNIASYKTMEALGGRLIKKYYDKRHGLCRKYLINTNQLAKYSHLYEPKALIKRK